jgi:hypothetical protein
VKKNNCSRPTNNPEASDGRRRRNVKKTRKDKKHEMMQDVLGVREGQ